MEQKLVLIEITSSKFSQVYNLIYSIKKNKVIYIIVCFYMYISVEDLAKNADRTSAVYKLAADCDENKRIRRRLLL